MSVNTFKGLKEREKDRGREGGICVVSYLVLQRLDEPVEQPRNARPHKRANPVDPVLSVKRSRDHARAKRPRRVETAAGELDAHHLCDEQGQPDAHGRNKGGAVLLGREHVDGKHQFGRQQGLDEDALGEVGAAREGGAHVEVLGEQIPDEHRGEDAAQDLREEEADRPDKGDGADEDHG